jgi:DNA-binding response OmpR family regulator
VSGEHAELSGPDFTLGLRRSELPDGGMVAGYAHSKPVLVARQADEVFAIGAHCTHYAGPPADGRMSGDRAGGARAEHYRLGEITVDVPTRSVRRAGEPVVLRPKELDLLVALCRASGAVVSRAALLNRVWGYGPTVVTRTVDTRIAGLRQRLEVDPEDPRVIITVWKAGYRVASETDDL